MNEYEFEPEPEHSMLPITFTPCDKEPTPDTTIELDISLKQKTLLENPSLLLKKLNNRSNSIAKLIFKKLIKYNFEPILPELVLTNLNDETINMGSNYLPNLIYFKPFNYNNMYLLSNESCVYNLFHNFGFIVIDKNTLKLAGIYNFDNNHFIQKFSKLIKNSLKKNFCKKIKNFN